MAQHVPDLDRIERMRAVGLLALVKKLGEDPKAMVEASRKHDAEVQDYCRKFPAFGVLEFDLTVELLGRRVTRKVRVQYEHTPDWECWDLLKEAPFVGWAMSSLNVEFRTAGDADNTGGGRTWEKLGILDIGEVWNVIDDAIERRCKVEDAKRRRAAARRRGG